MRNKIINYEYVDPLENNVTLTCDEGGLLTIRPPSLFDKPYRITPGDVAIGVVGDAHGHLLNGLYQLDDWVNLTRRPLDFVVQTGDLTDESVNSSPSSSSYRGSDLTLGLRDLEEGSQKWSSLLSTTLNLRDKPIYFISGNHDVAELDRMFQSGALFGKNLEYLENGETVRWVDPENSGRSVKIGAIGWNYRTSDLSKIEEKRPDILISHSDIPLSGMSKEAAKYTFFGHHKDAISRSNPLASTYGLEHLTKVGTPYRSGSCGVLYLNPSNGEGKFIHIPEKLSNVTVTEKATAN